MSFEIFPTLRFKKEAKKLQKRFPSLKTDLKELETILQHNPEYGVDLGNNTFKIRLAIKSKGKGKSGGARVITYLIYSNREIYLLSIYDKSDFSIIDDKTLKRLIAEIKNSK